MRVELYGSFGKNKDGKTFELDENFQGVSTFDELHSGQYRVKSVSNVRVYRDHISILVELRDGDSHSELTVPDEVEPISTNDRGARSSEGLDSKVEQ